MKRHLKHPNPSGLPWDHSTNPKQSLSSERSWHTPSDDNRRGDSSRELHGEKIQDHNLCKRKHWKRRKHPHCSQIKSKVWGWVIFHVRSTQREATTHTHRSAICSVCSEHCCRSDSRPRVTLLNLWETEWWTHKAWKQQRPGGVVLTTRWLDPGCRAAFFRASA